MTRRVTAAQVAAKEGFVSAAWKGLIRVVEQHQLPIAEREDGAAPSPCGHCGMVMDAASSPSGRKPDPGDYSVCWSCAGVNRFDVELRLVRVSDAEAESIDSSKYDTDALVETRALIRAAMTRSYLRGGSA